MFSISCSLYLIPLNFPQRNRSVTENNQKMIKKDVESTQKSSCFLKACTFSHKAENLSIYLLLHFFAQLDSLLAFFLIFDL